MERVIVAEESYRPKPPVLDVSGLPNVVFGKRNTVWLGTILFMLIEGSMVAMLIAAYFYYRTRSSDWPPGVMAPELRWGVINTIGFAASGVPAWIIKKRAKAADQAGCRLWLIILAVFAIANTVIRGFEFAGINCRWDANAYASTVWLLLGVHTTHLLTNMVETIVLAALAFTDRVDGLRFTDFDENSDYWFFVIGVAIAINIVVYGATRWLG